MGYTWRTDENGLLRVRDDGGDEFTPTLSDGAQVALIESGIARFGMLFRNVGETCGVDWHWLVAMAFRESGFNPRAFRQERDKAGQPIAVDGRLLTGIGLFQLTSPGIKGKMTDEQLFDATANTALAARHIANLMKRAECRVDGVPDFVRVSAAYNAGSVRPSTANKWGFVVTGAHLDVEVAALNYTILRGLEELQRAAANAVALQFDLVTTTLDDRFNEKPSDPESNA